MSIDKIDSTKTPFEAEIEEFRCKAEVLGSQVRLGEAEADQKTIDQLVELVIELKAFIKLHAAFSGTKEAERFLSQAGYDKEHWFGNVVTTGFDMGMLKDIPVDSPEWERNSDLTDEVGSKVLEQSMDRYRSSKS